MINREVSLLGIGLYGCLDHKIDFHIEMKLVEEHETVLGEVAGFYDGSEKIFRVLFHEPVHLGVDIQYQLIVKIKVRIFKVSVSIPWSKMLKIKMLQNPNIASLNVVECV